jgi:hypothetical protein
MVRAVGTEGVKTNVKWCIVIRMRHSATGNVALYASELVPVLKLTHIRCAT